MQCFRSALRALLIKADITPSPNANCIDLDVSRAENLANFCYILWLERRRRKRQKLRKVYWNIVHSDPRYRASTIIGKYVLFTLFVFGSIGNLLSFAVMVKRPMRSSSTAFYMAALALADTTVMFIGCLRRWVIEVFQVDLLNNSPEACKAVNFFQYWSFDVAVWTLVAMTIDRAIVVIAPLKAFLPFTLLLVMNIIIIVNLSKANARKHKMTNNFQQRKKSGERQGTISQKLTMMLLSVTSAFLLLTAPAAILDILRWQGAPYFDLSKTNDMALYILCRQITRVLLYMNHSINFFLYCVTGCKFRKELFSTLRCQSSTETDRRRSTINSMPNGSATNTGYVSSSPQHESSM
ncbi:galanin receptor 2a-like [Watersipora subatra]|uniref:galanin receptor 2a-like n=1 Tax=Watersipora subatra TaxID=2589382 RepID=UPI00355C9C3F